MEKISEISLILSIFVIVVSIMRIHPQQCCNCCNFLRTVFVSRPKFQLMSGNLSSECFAS